MTKNINILVVDDHKALRKGIIKILSDFPFIDKWGEAENGLKAIEALEKEQYDIVYLDIQMPKMGGIETAKIIKTRFPLTKIIVFTIVEYKKEVIQMLEIGVESYILKDGDEITMALEQVLTGNTYLSPDINKIWLEYLVDKMRNKLTVQDKEILSKREEEVLLLFCNEKSTKEIAIDLYISPLTVKNHFENMKKKLNVKTKIGLLLSAINAGIFKG